MELLVLAVILAFVIPILRRARTARGMAEVQQWADRQGLRIVEITRPFWRGGPELLHRKGDIVFKLRLAAPGSEARPAWARWRPFNYRSGEARVSVTFV